MAPAKRIFPSAMLLLLLTIHMHSVRTQAADMDIQQYCDFDVIFNPQCGEHEAIVIKHARFGRMREGKCIQKGEGSLGCSMDAREALDQKCSGRQSCEVVVITIPPRDNPPCHHSLRGYLEAAYECVTVVYPPKGYCLPSEVVDVKKQGGYFSSLVTRETGCGSTDHPWWISAKPGQHVRFHLLVFDSSSTTGKYATIQEEGRKTSKAVYAGTSRRSLVYTSSSNRVKVTLQPVQLQGESAPFLLEFEVIGCSDLPAPENGWVRRNGEEAMMGCNNTDEHEGTWKRHCEDGHWTGDSRKCAIAQAEKPTPVVAEAKETFEFSLKPEQKVLLITIAVGIADVIGFCILICGILYICRRWKARRRYLKQSIKTTERTRNRTAERRSLAKEAVEEEGEYYCPTESDYYGTWQMKHLRKGPSAAQPGPSSPDGNVPPLPPPYTPSCGSSSYYCNSQGDDHVYERPIFLPGQVVRGEDGSRSLKYYELDPNYADSTQTNNKR